MSAIKSWLSVAVLVILTLYACRLFSLDARLLSCHFLGGSKTDFDSVRMTDFEFFCASVVPIGMACGLRAYKFRIMTIVLLFLNMVGLYIYLLAPRY